MKKLANAAVLSVLGSLCIVIPWTLSWAGDSENAALSADPAFIEDLSGFKLAFLASGPAAGAGGRGVREPIGESADDWWGRHTQGAPFTGRHRILFTPEKLEDEMGELSYRMELAKSKLSQDSRILAMVGRVARRIIAVSGRPDFHWEIAVIDDTHTVNAFCLPGGKIAVYTGMLSIDSDDASLATTLGHEVGHAIARHSGESMSKVLLMGGIGIAGSAVMPAALPILVPGISAALLNVIPMIYELGDFGAMIPAELHFSRVEESEADYIGLVLMAKAGYDPQAGVEETRRLFTAYPDPRFARIVKYFSTHPLGSQRIANMERWLPRVRETYYHPAP